MSHIHLCGWIKAYWNEGEVTDDTETIFLDAATNSLKTDTGLGTVTRIGKIAMQLQNVGLDEIQFVTVPTEYYPRDSEFFGSVFWTEDADTIWQLINEDKPLPRSVLDTAITAEPPATSSEAQGGGAGETPSGTPQPEETPSESPSEEASPSDFRYSGFT